MVIEYKNISSLEKMMNLKIILEYPRTWGVIPSSRSRNHVPKFPPRNQASRRLALLLHHRRRQISVVAEFISSMVHICVKLLNHKISLSLPPPSSITSASLCHSVTSEIVIANSLYRKLKARSTMVKFPFLHIWSFKVWVIINLTPNSQIIQSSPQIQPQTFKSALQPMIYEIKFVKCNINTWMPHKMIKMRS